MKTLNITFLLLLTLFSYSYQEKIETKIKTQEHLAKDEPIPAPGYEGWSNIVGKKTGLCFSGITKYNNLMQMNCGDYTELLWKLEKTDKGTKILSKTGDYFTVSNYDSAPVTLTPKKDSDKQYWEIIHLGTNAVQIKNKGSKKCIIPKKTLASTVKRPHFTLGYHFQQSLTNIYTIADCDNKNEDQLFIIQAPAKKVELPKGWVNIVGESGLCISSRLSAATALLQVQKCADFDFLLWKLEEFEDGIIIKNKTGRVMLHKTVVGNAIMGFADKKWNSNAGEYVVWRMESVNNGKHFILRNVFKKTLCFSPARNGKTRFEGRFERSFINNFYTLETCSNDNKDQWFSLEAPKKSEVHIPEGWFNIEATSGLCLSSRGRTQSISQQKCGDNTDSLLWKIVRVAKGYVIQNKNPKRMMHSLGNKNVSGGEDDINSKYFVGTYDIEPVNNGKYVEFRFYESNLCVDDSGSPRNEEPGINKPIYAQECRHGDKRQWFLLKSPKKSLILYPEGWFNIVGQNGRCMAAGKKSGHKNTQVDCKEKNVDLLWKVEKDVEENIKNAFSGLRIVSKNGLQFTDMGTNMTMNKVKYINLASGHTQMFAIEPFNDGKGIFIRNYGSNKCLSDDGLKAHSVSDWLAKNKYYNFNYDCDNTNKHQSFTFVDPETGKVAPTPSTHPVVEPTPTPVVSTFAVAPLPDGWFNIVGKKTGLCFSGLYKYNNLMQMNCGDYDELLWKLEKTDKGTRILSKTGDYFAVSNYDSAPVTLTPKSDSDKQHWEIIHLGTNAVQIKNKGSKKCIIPKKTLASKVKKTGGFSIGYHFEQSLTNIYTIADCDNKNEDQLFTMQANFKKPELPKGWVNIVGQSGLCISSRLSYGTGPLLQEQKCADFDFLLWKLEEFEDGIIITNKTGRVMLNKSSAITILGQAQKKDKKWNSNAGDYVVFRMESINNGKHVIFRNVQKKTLCLDLTADKSFINNNYTLALCSNDNKNQWFTLEAPKKSELILPEGWINIRAKSGLCLSSRGRMEIISQQKCGDNTDSLLWKIIRTAKGYVIQNKNPKRIMRSNGTSNVSGGEDDFNNANAVVTYDIEPVNHGKYVEFRFYENNLCVDDSGSYRNDLPGINRPIVPQECRHSDDRQWFLLTSPKKSPILYPEEGYHNIVGETGLCLSTSEKTLNGYRNEQVDCKEKNRNILWKVEKDGEENTKNAWSGLRIINKNGKHFIEQTTNSMADKKYINKASGIYSMFAIEPVNGGKSFAIRNYNTNRCLSDNGLKRSETKDWFALNKYYNFNYRCHHSYKHQSFNFVDPKTGKPFIPAPVKPTKEIIYGPVVKPAPTPVEPTPVEPTPVEPTPVEPTPAPVLPPTPAPVLPPHAPVLPPAPAPVLPPHAPVLPPIIPAINIHSAKGPYIFYYQNYFVGHWNVVGYHCNKNTPAIEKVKITRQGMLVTAVKLTGDDCIPAGVKTFTFNQTEKLYRGQVFEKCQLQSQFKGVPVPKFELSKITIIDLNTFKLGNLTYYRIMGPDFRPDEVYINMTPMIGGKYQGPRHILLNPKRNMRSPVRRFVIVEESTDKPGNC